MASSTFECPNGCGFSEVAGRAPHHNPCPGCFKPAGLFVAKKSPVAKAAAKVAKRGK